MRNYFFFLSAFLSVCFSCTTGVEVKENDFSSFIHDGNSKVWMISEIIKDESDYSKKGKVKDLFIFYNNGNCVFQSTDELLMNKGKLGTYEILDLGKTIRIDFDKDKWEFTINKSHQDEIYLLPTKNSDFDYSLILIPFPQLIR